VFSEYFAFEIGEVKSVRVVIGVNLSAGSHPRYYIVTNLLAHADHVFQVDDAMIAKETSQKHNHCASWPPSLQTF
jgi:hypothetical protein